MGILGSGAKLLKSKVAKAGAKRAVKEGGGRSGRKGRKFGV